MDDSPAARKTLERVRSLLLGVLFAASLGTAVELLLLEHYEEFWQLTPLALLGIGAIVTAWHFLRRDPVSARALQITMVLFIVSGVLGMFFHYESNVEFALEVAPSLAGFRLFRTAVTGGNPALAPGTMIQLGLLGLIGTYRRE